MRPTIRDSVSVYTEGANVVHFVLGNQGLHKTYDADESFCALLLLLDGTRQTDEITVELCARFPHVSPEDIHEALTELRTEQIITDLDLKPNPDWFTAEELERYHKHLLLWDDIVTHTDRYSIQYNLKRSRVALLGLGGTGSWFAWALSMAGVGAIRLCDFDRVERSNLNRQGLYRVSDIGRLKTDAARAHINALNPNVAVEAQTLLLTEETDLSAALDGVDLVINCTDQPTVYQTGLWVARACMPRRIPHIVGGGYNTHLGKIGPTILPFETACWTCFASTVADPRLDGSWQPLLVRGHSYHGGNTGTIAAIIANMQAWDAVRVLGQVGPPLLANRMGEFDFQSLEITWKQVERDQACSMCGTTSQGSSEPLVVSGGTNHDQ